MDAELRARDILATLPVRATVGHALVRRVGGRAWTVPSFAKGRAIFRRCGLPDPWDPDAPSVEIGLGDVGVDIAGRKPVAPHAAPPGAPTANAPSFGRGVPSARVPAAEASAAPQLGSSRPLTEKEKQRLKGPEPKRVQGAAPRRAASTFGPPPPQHAVAKLPVRPGAAVPAPPAPPAAAAPPAPPAAPPNPTPAAPATAAPPEAPPAPAARAEPPPPTRKPPSTTGGLDDLFGMGGGETRIRMPARDATPAARKKVVSSEEDLSRGGVDRRPPPPKPPGKE